MIADFFTKPLQGALFYQFRNAVLGIDAENFDQYKRKYYDTLKEFDLLDSETSAKSQECVERESASDSIRNGNGLSAGTRDRVAEDLMQDRTSAIVNSPNKTVKWATKSSNKAEPERSHFSFV